MKFVAVEAVDRFCRKCKTLQPISNFGKNSRTTDRISFSCKRCNRTECKASYAKHRTNRCKSMMDRAKSNPHEQWARNCISGHKRNGFIVTISVAELSEIAKNISKCPLCNENIVWEYGIGQKWNGPSLDRIYNSPTISKGNSMIICRSCNVTKRDRTINEFIFYCQKIANKFSSNSENNVSQCLNFKEKVCVL